MICAMCQKNPANFTKLVQGRVVPVCIACANNRPVGFSVVKVTTATYTPNFITSFEQHAPKNQICPVCGRSYDDFRQTSKLGCSNCYSVFARELEPVIRGIHGKG
jgi:protein arginine kinase activator